MDGARGPPGPRPVATHDFHLFRTDLPEATDALHRVGEFLGRVGDPARPGAASG